MTPRSAHALAGIGALATAVTLWACGPRSSPFRVSTARRSPLVPVVPTLIHPARYVATDEAGVSFDDAGRASELPRPEPALVDGVRILLQSGVVLARHSSPDYLSGFSSLPDRLGGGFIFWSGHRTYRAGEFSGELVAAVDVACSGGVRPWFHTAILRTERGLFELDPKSGSVRRLDLPGTADMRAQDARRALRVDQVGRAAFTTDAGARWTDILATRSVTASGIGVGEGGELLVLGPSAPELVLDPAGHLVPWVPRSPQDEANERDPGDGRPRVDWPGDFSPVAARSSMTLSDSVAGGILAGALLPGGRLLVLRDKALSILSAANAEPLAVAGLLGLSDDYARCQPVMAGPWGKRPEADVLLACSHDRGAHVLVLDRSLAAPKLEATFPEPGGFVAGLSGRFGFAGRCGTEPPGVVDFHIPDGSAGASPGSPQAIEHIADEPETPDPHPEAAASFCVRAGAGDWVERRLSGEEARHLYRFLPGDDATVTALVLKAPGSESDKAPAEPASREGLRVVRVSPGDPALGGGRFPPIAPIRVELPYRSIESDYWLDERDGSIRGWLLMPGSEDEPDSEPAEPSAQPIGRRAAGLRISLEGKIEVYPLPKGVVAVVRGGPFALALAETDGNDTYHETTDGGQTWRPVEGPPAMGMSPLADPGDVSGCSAAGCTWGGGIVRLGWGSSGNPSDKPILTPVPPPAAAAAPSGVHVQGPSPIALHCQLKSPAEQSRPGGAKNSSRPITLFSPSERLGTVQQGGWTAEVAVPFGRTPSRRISLRDESLDGLSGVAVPLLTGSAMSPIDMVLLGRTDAGQDAPGFRIGPGNALHAWDYPGRIAVMAELSGGPLVAFDAEHSTMVLARGDAVQPIFRLTRVPDVSRTSLTLARRADAPGLALAGISRTSGDIFTGPVDLVRGEIGPLVAAGRLNSLTPANAAGCQAPARNGPVYRMLADVDVSLSLSRPGEEKIAEPSLRGAALLLAMPERVCLEGLIVQVPGKEGVNLSVQVGAGAATLRDTKGARQAQCDVVPAAP